MSTPVFDEVFKTHNPFSVMPAEYTDRFTPEVARQQGITAGIMSELQHVIDLIDGEFEKPTKQLVLLRDSLALRLEMIENGHI